MRLVTLVVAAARNLGAHPLRSLLTVIGIIAGVVAVVLVTAIVQGTRQQIQDNIAQFGANRMDVNSGSLDGRKNATLLFGGLYQLDERDVALIRANMPQVVAGSGFLRGSAEVYHGRAQALVTWIGGNHQAARVMGHAVAHGRQFSEAEGAGAARLALLGHETARRLFGDQDPLGGRIRVKDAVFNVVGVLAPKGADVSGSSQDEIVILPAEAARRQLMADFPLPAKAVQQIGLLLADRQQRDAVEQTITALLGARRGLRSGDVADFHVVSIEAAIRASRQTEASMSFLLAAVGLICLLVGGVGVMNILLVSVNERIGEIGLRMAIGASPASIRWLFLCEAVLLALGGGVLGCLLGLALSHWVAATWQMHLLVSPAVLLLALLVSLLVGMAAGLWPAHRAASMKPVDALRRL